MRLSGKTLSIPCRWVRLSLVAGFATNSRYRRTDSPAIWMSSGKTLVTTAAGWAERASLGSEALIISMDCSRSPTNSATRS